MMETDIKKINIIDVLIAILAIIFILFGLLINKIIILFGVLTLIIYIAAKDTNIIYSVLITLFVFHGTYLVQNLSFEWSLLYYLLSILILGLIVTRKIEGEKFKVFFKDKYLHLMLMILIWGSLSATVSTNPVQSFKNILSIFLVFIIFYLVPKYFYSKRERLNLIKYVALPLNLITSLIASLNLLIYFELININTKLFEWRVTSAIYRNPNQYGIGIMLTLIVTNLLFELDKEFADKNKKSILQKILIFNYPVLLINLLLSGSRAALLGMVIAFIPLVLKKKKQAVTIIAMGAVFLSFFSDNLLLLKKVEKGTTSGRWNIWSYGINNVITKYPILGIGAGASGDHIGIFGGLSIHNSYLNLIMSLGLVGFLLWVLILALVFYASFKNEENKHLFIFTILGIMVFAFFETSLFGGMGRTMGVFWMVVMLIKENKFIKH